MNRILFSLRATIKGNNFGDRGQFKFSSHSKIFSPLRAFSPLPLHAHTNDRIAIFIHFTLIYTQRCLQNNIL